MDGNRMPDTILRDSDPRAVRDSFWQWQKPPSGGALDQGHVVRGLDQVPESSQLTGREDGQLSNWSHGYGRAQGIRCVGQRKRARNESVAALQVVGMIGRRDVFQPCLDVSRCHLRRGEDHQAEFGSGRRPTELFLDQLQVVQRAVHQTQPQRVQAQETDCCGHSKQDEGEPAVRHIERPQPRQHNHCRQERRRYYDPAPPDGPDAARLEAFGALGLEGVLEGAAQMATGPVSRRRLQDELGQCAPSGRHASQCGQYAEQGICLGGALGDQLAVAQYAQRQVLRLAQAQRYGGDLLARQQPSGVAHGRPQARLGIRGAELGFQEPSSMRS